MWGISQSKIRQVFFCMVLLPFQLSTACGQLETESEACSRLHEESRLLRHELESLRRLEKSHEKMKRVNRKLEHDFVQMKVSRGSSLMTQSGQLATWLRLVSCLACSDISFLILTDVLTGSHGAYTNIAFVVAASY